MGDWGNHAWETDEGADWFGGPYMVPSQYGAELAALLRKSIEVLGHMIAPPSDDWAFLDLWEGDEAVKEDVSNQIAALQARLAQLS
ncbi:hypothetical protein HI113_14020 [Corallococcus exiguus]|uniref:hypothetical protein n=1 Tax=Corallococcus TaxID=83461 RepID=UPI000ED18AA7|nr:MULTISPECIES: hypothetical protein [Corallococcus]NNB95012.1 hypothetical protein [Corallococcus exiguus]NPC49115.1 hypothetical protein [Corallococcus exiguus]RKH76442.1 hypothetical protein D7X99_34760 [Corallococcus sp. AB032C]